MESGPLTFFCGLLILRKIFSLILLNDVSEAKESRKEMNFPGGTLQRTSITAEFKVILLAPFFRIKRSVSQKGTYFAERLSIVRFLFL